jgi:hypothetical protein
VLVIVVCVHVVRYTVEEHVFLHELYVKFGSARKCQRKFPRVTVGRTTGIHEFINKVRSTGSLLDKKPTKKWCMLTKEKPE